ncbi:MAG: ABC transporter permease [Anaerolineae bacterium]
MPRRIGPIVRKEFLHILRDPRTLVIMFLIPVVQLVLLGYAAVTEVDHLPTVLLDRDRTSSSRALIRDFEASGYFDFLYEAADEKEMALLMDSGTARAGLSIPAGYQETVQAGRLAQVGFAIDGSDPTVATSALSAAQALGQVLSAEMVALRLSRQGLTLEPIGVDVRTRVWYNPDLKNSNFMIPGLIAIVLQVLTTMLTALAIVREREQGTIELLIVTPIQPFELVVGKLVPYVAIAFVDLLEVLAIGTWWFKVPIHGSVPLLLGLAAISLMTSLGLGLLISTLANTQREAMLLVWFTVLPSIFLSGFLFPTAAMPPILQAFSYAIPLTYLLVIVRGIILKGIGLALLREQTLALVVFGVVLLTVASLRFRKRLE